MAQDDQKINLIFVINGVDFDVRTNVDAVLISAVEKALSESGNTGRRDPSEWEVRDANGAQIDIHRKVKDLGLGNNARLFLSLRVGAGGNFGA